MGKNDIEYKATPVILDFHRHPEYRFRGLRGPIGSGKSVGCIMEIFWRSMQQAAFKGVRRSRWAVIRNTFGELKSTTLKTWTDWVPENQCPITWGSPITAHYQRGMGDGTRVELEVFFFPLDKPKDVRKVLSMELTGVWFNEARELSRKMVQDTMGRLGRYPSKRMGGASWHGAIADTNSPHSRHWWYDLAEVKRPSNYRFWHQPGGLKLVTVGGVQRWIPNPAAENIENLPGGYRYYQDLVEGATPEWVKVYCGGEYGNVFDGMPVYQDLWADSVHASAEPLAPLPGLPLHLGWDFGLTPACVVGQVSTLGQLRILREYCCTRGGVRQLVKDIVAPALRNDFPGYPVGTSTGDPAGTAGSQHDQERTAIGELKALGIPTEAAPTNEFAARKQAVVEFLLRREGFTLDPSCVLLREGFGGGYRFAPVQISGAERYHETPEKNEFSHPHDALQYLCLRLDPSKGGTAGRRGVAQVRRSAWGGMV